MMPSTTSAMKLALRRLPSVADRSRTAIASPAGFRGSAASPRALSIAALGELERSETTSSSPFTKFFDLAVNHGHTLMGPPPKYQLSQSPVLKCGISEDDLSFKTTNYGRLMQTPYVQHEEHKVTMRVKWSVLPLNEFEKRILMEIVGARYTPKWDQLQITSHQFGSRIENKRHLTSMLDRLVFAARRLAKEAQEERAKRLMEEETQVQAEE